jgi:hypothetical protein
MAVYKTPSERWWQLYLDDNGYKENFNGLHLICALYGDDEEDSDTLMQSMVGNKHGQLFALEHCDSESMFKETISSCMWRDQYPEGFFAHLQSQLCLVLGLKTKSRVQNWERWGWDIIQYDNDLRNLNRSRWVGDKKLEQLLTEEQKTKLKNRLIHYHGEERNGKIVVKDWYNPWMSREADEYANYIRRGWQC